MFPVSLLAQYEEIWQLLHHKRYVSAEKKVSELLRTEPANSAHWYWQSHVLLMKKDTAGLMKLGEQLPATIADDAWTDIVRGSIALASDNATEARSLFDKAADRGRKNADILAAVAAANIYSRGGDKGYAIELLNKAIKRNKKDPELHKMLGDAYFRMSNGSDAYAAYNNALKLNTAFAPALYEIGKIFLTQHNTDVYLDYFNRAVAADAGHAPALYELYSHYRQHELERSLDFFKRYYAATDVAPADDYHYANMLYLTRHYDEAEQKIQQALPSSPIENEFRKLLAFVYREANKPDSAIVHMKLYLADTADTDATPEDYAFMASVFEKVDGQRDSAAVYYLKALAVQTDTTVFASYYKKLADFAKARKDYASQAHYLEQYHHYEPNAGNVDLFNWGIALYQTSQYAASDSVFGIYATKYPDQVYGHYWRARSNAAIDTAMTQGLALPYYEALIKVAEKDTTVQLNKKYLGEAYGYLATYAANQKDDYAGAIEYFEKLLEVDPGNEDAQKYIEILERRTANAPR
jgi:tetratricopeptide (TPR) repeat protein